MTRSDKHTHVGEVLRDEIECPDEAYEVRAVPVTTYSYERV